MASSTSGIMDGGGGSPVSPPAAVAPRAVVMDSLIDLRGQAEMLRNILQGSPTPPGTPADASELIDGMMSSLSSALSALDTTGGGGGGQAGHGRRRRRRIAGAVAASAGPQRRTSTTRRR